MSSRKYSWYVPLRQNVTATELLQRFRHIQPYLCDYPIMSRRRKRRSGRKATGNSVTAESFIQFNINKLKKCYNAIPSRKKGKGVSAVNSGNDLRLIAEVFGERTKDREENLGGTHALESDTRSSTYNDEGSVSASIEDPRLAMLFLDDTVYIPQENSPVRTGNKVSLYLN